MRKLLMIIAAIVGVFVLLVGGGIGFGFLDAYGLDGSRELYTVSYELPDGMTGGGYLATPEGSGPCPALLMIHEWWGLRPDILQMADSLSEQGYIVFAPDAYRGLHAGSVPGALALNLSYENALVKSDLDAAFAYLQGLPQADSERKGIMGFCFGGREAMWLGVRNPDVDTAVLLYGSGIITEQDELGSLGLNGPVLGIFGEEDESIPIPDIRSFESGLLNLGREVDIEIYPGVGHAFVHPGSIASGGAAGEAWGSIIGFFEEVFQQNTDN